MPSFDQSDQLLLEQLNAHPQLKARMINLLAVVTDAGDDMKRFRSWWPIKPVLTGASIKHSSGRKPSWRWLILKGQPPPNSGFLFSMARQAEVGNYCAVPYWRGLGKKPGFMVWAMVPCGSRTRWKNSLAHKALTLSTYTLPASTWRQQQRPARRISRWLWRQQQKQRLKQSDTITVLKALESCCEPQTTSDAEAPVRTAHRYLSNRIDQLDYQRTLEQGLPIGSG